MASGSEDTGTPISSGDCPGNDVSGRGIVTPPDSLSLLNYQFTFQQTIDDAVAASFRIEADPHPNPDTQSVTSSISRYRIENGRTFHAYKDGSYMFPNDEEELERQDYQHLVTKYLMGNKNYFAPWSQDNPPRSILDIGTGTGMWAIEMGDEFPSAQIIGTDLSPIQSRNVPPTVTFIVEDSREPWSWYGKDTTFDYIHTRWTIGCWENIRDDILQKSFDQLAPGGWFEVQDCLPTIQCDDDTMPDDFELKLHLEDLMDATAAMGRPLHIVDQYKKVMEEVGFVDVTEHYYKVPINTWPKQREYKYLGKLWEDNLLSGMHAASVGPLHRVRGLSDKQIQMMLVPVRQAIQDQSVHAYQKFYIVCGRKPYPGEVLAGSEDIPMGGAS
ncbi:tam domain protein [Xylariales sp. PMI_506]|nr:tam domain protein [Xylariales sp. PMI_506]